MNWSVKRDSRTIATWKLRLTESVMVRAGAFATRYKISSHRPNDCTRMCRLSREEDYNVFRARNGISVHSIVKLAAKIDAVRRGT